MNWEGYAWIAWLAAFFILETIGLWKRPTGGMTLTFFIENHFPRGLLAAVIGFLALHFLDPSERDTKG
jgi:hypothetical protein